MPAARRALLVLVWIAVALAGAGTLLGFLDRWSWTLQLVGFFRLQYAVLLAGAAACALLLRRLHLGGLALALVAANVVVIAPRGGADLAWANDRTERVRVLVANVEVGNVEYERMADAIREADADVLVLTELTPTWARALRTALAPYRARRLALRPDAYGIGVYSRIPFASSRVVRFPHRGGPPSIVARLRAGAGLTLVGTHVHRPIEGAIHAEHLEALAEAAPSLGSPLAICGDFNAVPWSGPFRSLADRARLEHLYEDSWPAYTWPTWNPVLRLTLDNCLVGGAGVRSHRRIRDVGSDHFPLVVDLAVPPAR